MVSHANLFHLHNLNWTNEKVYRTCILHYSGIYKYDKIIAKQHKNTSFLKYFMVSASCFLLHFAIHVN